MDNIVQITCRIVSRASITFFLCCAGFVFGASGSWDPSDCEILTQDLSAKDQHMLEGMSYFFKEKKYQDGLEFLRSFVNETDAPWQLQLFEAEAWREMGHYDKSVTLYRHVKDNLATRVKGCKAILVNLAEVLVQKRDYEEARVTLMEALDVVRPPDDARLYLLLAVVYERRDQLPDAVRAYQLAIAADPGFIEVVRKDIERLLPKISSGSGPIDVQQLFSPPDPERLISIISMGNVAELKGATLVKAITEYVSYSEHLAQSGWPRAAKRYRTFALKAVLGPTLVRCAENDDEKCLELLGPIVSEPNFKDMPHLITSTAYVAAANAYTQLDQYLHAVEALEQASSDGDKPSPSMIKLVKAIQRKAFAAVSFDPSNGMLRGQDLDDFVSQLEIMDIAGLEQEDSDLGRGVKELLSKSQLEQSHSEDWAAMDATARLVSEDPGARKRLCELFDARIRSYNLELPVKCLLHSSMSSFLDESCDKTGATLLKTLEVAMNASGTPNIPASTRDSFLVGTKLRQFLRRATTID